MRARNWRLVLLVFGIATGGGQFALSQQPTPAPVQIAPQAPPQSPTTRPPVQQTAPSTQGPQVVAPSPAPSSSQSTATRFVSTGTSTSSDTILAFLNSRTRRHSSRMPEMLGDYGVRGPVLAYSDHSGFSGASVGEVHLPVPSGLTRMRIAEFNKAMPVDRIFASYHFYNNIGYQTGTVEDPATIDPDASVATGIHVHRWTIGAESTFEGGRSSIEFRLPIGFSDIADFSTGSSPYARVGDGDNTFGNLSLILKRIGAVGECGVFSYGLGIEIPTGEDGEFVAGSNRFEYGNDAVHLSPFLAIMKHDCQGRWFCNSFLQVDVPLGGNDLVMVDRPSGASTTLGEFNDPVRLLSDLGIGRWLSTSSTGWSLAALGEIHTVTALGDGDSISYSETGAFGTDSGTVTAAEGTVVNSTVGLHLSNPIGWRLRFGAAAPITDTRLFDAELQLQAGRVY